MESGYLAQKVVIGIKQNGLRFTRLHDADCLLGFVDPGSLSRNSASRDPSNGHIQLIDRRTILRVLRLPEGENNYLLCIVPGPCVIQHRVPRFKDPLIKEWLKIDSRSLSHCSAEIVAVNECVPVLGQIMTDSLIENFVAQGAPQGVEDGAALTVAMGVKHRVRVPIEVG